MPIRVLDPESASKIAAGEVVERPASVAKELIENAIDAEATRIGIEVKDGGSGLIRIVDNGSGIGSAELAVAFERHATSKIQSSEDLEAIVTLGFRGEALPSIAAVAQVTLISRPEGQAAGAKITMAGGHIVEQTGIGAPVGTSVTVRNLFFNTPARLKFLRSPLAEGGQITRLVGQFALAYPGIGFSLTVDGRSVLQTSGSGELVDVVARLYGADVARSMLPVELGEEMQIRGLVSQPAVSRGSRGYITLFVNGRIIQSRQLVHAIEESYSSLLMVGRHPVAVIHISLNPTQVDVNVHPSKAEVKFAAERQVFSRVRQAVQQAMARVVTVPHLTVEPFAGAAPAGWSGGRPEIEASLPFSMGRPEFGLETPTAPMGVQPAPWEQAPGQAAGLLPMLRVIGQLALTYIVAEGPGGMYLIDQHAAHERVRLDQIERSRQNDTGQVPDAQLLLQPMTIEVTPAQAACLEGAAGALSRLGFQIEPFGDRTYLLRAVPALLRQEQARATIGAILDELAGDPQTENFEDHIAHSLACHSAVRAGQPLSDDEMRALVAQLERCWQPHHCAHGRPTMVHFSQTQLEKEFGRR